MNATGALESIVVTWVKPTTRADGTAASEGELAGFYVYWSDAPGINIANPATYDGKVWVNGESYTFTLPDPGTTLGPYYFRVTAVNVEGQESAASSEASASADAESATPSAVDVDDWLTGNASDILVGYGRIFVKLRMPKSTWNRFAHYKVYYDVNSGGGFTGSWTACGTERIGYMHSGLTVTYYYKYKVTVVAEDGTETAGSIHDNGGTGYLPNVDNGTNLLTDTVAAQHIIAAYDMTAHTYYGAILQSLNYGAGAGTKIDLNAGTITMGGSSAPKFYFDGTNATIAGTVNATAGYFGDSSNRVAIEAAGLNVGTSGSIRGGATAYLTGTGFFIGYSGGAYKLSVGDPAALYWAWDGSALIYVGEIYDAKTLDNAGFEDSVVNSWVLDANIDAWIFEIDTLGERSGVYALHYGHSTIDYYTSTATNRYFRCAGDTFTLGAWAKMAYAGSYVFAIALSILAYDENHALIGTETGSWQNVNSTTYSQKTQAITVDASYGGSTTFYARVRISFKGVDQDGEGFVDDVTCVRT